MIIRVRFFARAKDLAEEDWLTLEVAAGATVGDLRRRLAQEKPRLAGLLERSAVAVQGEFADDTFTLPQGAEIALLPPVRGG
jgi:molybdopterin converting factor subunit 1